MPKIAWESFNEIWTARIDRINDEMKAVPEEDSFGSENFFHHEKEKPEYISTLIGPLLTDPLIPMGDRFNSCWLAYTDFEIKMEIRDILEEIPGVECLRVISKYTFFIGIGKMFDFQVVRQNIEDILCREYVEVPEEELISDEVFEKLYEHRYWAIFVNGREISYVSTDSLQEYETKSHEYDELQKTLGKGDVLRYSDVEDDDTEVKFVSESELVPETA